MEKSFVWQFTAAFGNIVCKGCPQF